LFDANKVQSIDAFGFSFIDEEKYINAAPDIGLIGSVEFDNDGSDRRIYPQTGWVQDAIADAVTAGVSGVELLSNKNQNNGYCGLDSGGKVPFENLPTTLLKYQGVWNASTNTPTLTSPDITKVGNVYNVSVAGTRFGIAFNLGDWLIYNASGIPEKSDNSDDVVSVNGQTGVVTITKSDVGLSNVDNTSDANKPVSTAQQIALNSKANLANPTFTGSVQVPPATAPNEAVNFGQISDKITYKSKATYVLMIADGTPTVPTIYNITNDENKSYVRSTYLWKPDGNREWLATTPDN
jgi:hypothetical protein